MTICERLSDRMVAVARGEAVWSAEDAGHLAGCADCASEWRLLATTRSLSRGVPIDADRVAAGVAGRLAARRERPAVVSLASRRNRIVWGLALAAGAVLAVAVPRGRGGPRPAPGVAVTATAGPGQPVLSELDDMSASELERVLEEVDGGAMGADTDRARMGDLTPAELERVLRSWES